MEMIVAFTACVLLVAMGDILSIASRAKIPAMAGIILLYLAATALGMPQDWPTLSGLAPLGDLMFPVFVAAVTTNILPRDVARQWKFILIGCIAVGVSMLVTVLAGGALLGFSTAFSGAVVTCGGAFTGGMLVMDHARETGATELVALPLLLAMTIDAIGQPIGSFVTKRYISRLKRSGGVPAAQASSSRQEERLNRYRQPYSSPENPSPFFTAWVPPKYETEAVALFQLAVTVLLATWLGELTGLGWAFMLVIIGLAGNFLGFFRLNMLQRTASSGIIMCSIFAMVFEMLNDLSWQLVLEQLLPFLVVVALGLAGLLLGGALGAKLLGCDPFLGAVASIGLFYFFPGVQNIVTEVCRSCAEGEEEYAALYRHLAPPAIITAFMGSRFCLLLTALLLPVVLS